jgi:hypothetical protein
MATIPRASRRADGAIRRQLAELAEHQHFLHHAVDAESGRLLTTSPARPPTALSRIEQLALFGRRFDPSIFGGPTQRLTPRAPYHASPFAWMTLYDASIGMPDGEDLTWWSIAGNLSPSGDLPGLRAHFEQPPQGHCLASLTLSGLSWPGQTGHVRIRVFRGAGAPTPVRIPVDADFGRHTTDLVFASIPGNPIELLVEFEPGVHNLAFTALTLASQLVLDPTP